MRNHFKSIAAFAVTLAAFGMLAAGFLVWPPQASALSRPLGELKTGTVTCSTSVAEIVSGDPRKNSMTIVNTTANAVYIGGSNVDGSTAGTTGIAVCDGCTAGKTFSLDVRRAYCVTTSGSQAIEVLYGR